MKRFIRSCYGIMVSPFRRKSNFDYYVREQFAYGHREILLEYMGLTKEYIFDVRLHHGNSLPNVLDPVEPMYDRRGKVVRQIYWRDDVNRLSNHTKGIEVISVGSPLLYLLSNQGSTLDQISKRLTDLSEVISKSEPLQTSLSDLSGNKILFFPMHSWEGDVLDHSAFAEEVSEIFPMADTTICLGYFDFCDPITRQSYLDFGFEVVCVGMRDSSVENSPAGGREYFLQHLTELILKHDLVFANQFTTGLLYANALGKRAEVIGNQIFNTIFSSHKSPRNYETQISEFESSYEWMYGNIHDSKEIRAKLNVSLGMRSFRSPNELMDILKPIKAYSIDGKRL